MTITTTSSALSKWATILVIGIMNEHGISFDREFAKTIQKSVQADLERVLPFEKKEVEKDFDDVFGK